MVCWSIVLGCAPAQRDWAPPQHSSSQLPRKAFMCICRIPPPFGDRNRYKVDALKKKIERIKPKTKTNKNHNRNKIPQNIKKTQKNPKPPNKETTPLKSHPAHLEQTQLSSGAMQWKGKGSGPFSPLLWHWSELTWGFVPFPLAGAAAPAPRCEFHPCLPFQRGISCWDRKQLNKRNGLLWGHSCLSPSVLCCSFYFLAPRGFLLLCSVWSVFPFFVCLFVHLSLWGFFCNKPMKSYSWSKFLKKRPQGNSSCFIQDFIQECNWNQQEQWGFWLHQVGWLLQAIKGYFVLGHKFPAA